MAIVLVIVGLLLGLGSSMVGTLMTTVKVRETKDLQDATVQSVVSWASANNRLPPDAATFASIAKTTNDAWGRPFVYLFDNSLAAAPITKDTICGRRSTNLTLSTTDPSAATTMSNVAFVILSASDDATIQATLNNTVGPPAISPPTLNGANFTSGNTIPLNTIGSATGTITIDVNNSDIVRYVTLDELRSKVGCQGAPLKILNNELPSGYTSTTYNAVIAADGGVPNYAWCIQTTTAGTAPAGITFKDQDNTAISSNLFKTVCPGAANWPAAGQLVLSGTPTPSGSNFFTVFVTDTNSNQASKPFVLTVNPN